MREAAICEARLTDLDHLCCGSPTAGLTMDLTSWELSSIGQQTTSHRTASS